MPRNIKNLLTFDIEEWYDANYPEVDFHKYEKTPSLLEPDVDMIIDLCARYGVRATCFVLGTIARKHPKIVKKLHNAGHEIASHGYDHDLIYKMSPDYFEQQLKMSCKVLENITGEKVLGFRAPSWSVKKENLDWYYNILENEGLKYSSSVFPTFTGLYGMFEDPQIHHPEINSKKLNIWEVPPSITSILKKKVGFYFRLFPFWYIKKHIKKINKNGKPVLIYIHPRELDPALPKLKLDFPENIIHYWGVKTDKQKLVKSLSVFSQTFCRIDDFINEV